MYNNDHYFNEFHLQYGVGWNWFYRLCFLGELSQGTTIHKGYMGMMLLKLILDIAMIAITTIIVAGFFLQHAMRLKKEMEEEEND